MPARYAVANTLSPRMASNGSKVTLPCLYARSVPPSPAMNDAIAKAPSLVRTTLMPDAAADRSLARTASMAEPMRLVRIFATTNAVSTRVARTTKQNGRRGKADPCPTRRSMPKRVGPLIGLPLLLTKSVFRNQYASTATARARVTTANGRPRMRVAGRPTTTPTTVAPKAAKIGAIGKGTPQLTVSGLRRNAATPANTSWASDTWPAKPVTTTNEREMTPKIRLVSRAERQVPWSETRATTAAAVAITVGTARLRGRGARPSEWRISSPRPGSGCVRQIRMARIRARGIISGSPDDGSQPYRL